MVSPRHWLGVACVCLPLGCFSPSPVDPAGSTGVGSTGGSSSGSQSSSTGSSGEPPGSSGAESSSSSSSSSSGGEELPSCEEYCGLMADHCEGDQEQFTGSQACEATCALIPPGANEDQLGNTVGCRIHHTILAGEEPDPHCFHSGPTGDDTCGAICESFCTIALGACTGDDEVWPDAEACIADCNMFDPDPRYASSLPDADTLACRFKHLTFATLQPEVHCDHIGLNSPVCQ